MKFKIKQRLLNGALLKRITTLEEKGCRLYVGNEASRGSFASLFPRVERLEKIPALVDDHIKRLADHDESIEALSETVDQLSTCKCEAGAGMLKRIAELERAVYNSPFSKIVMEEYAENIKTLVRDVDTLKIQFSNANLHYNGLIAEVLQQKKFLDKVQVILDRELDDRIKKTPGYKKEIAAMKMDANAPKDATGRSGFSMDKHVDMMVKKGRPRK
jgi:hypothetical protein